MRQIAYRLTLLVALLALTLTVEAASEAEYGKITKSWTMRADGSQEYRRYMELTLFTHTAMNGTYGESFITYNPDYQELKINDSYTRQKDGTIVRTPANAFVEVLPRIATDAPAFNRLKEMVIVHTGLELGATIYLDYSVITKPGYYPALDIDELLRESSPVKEYEVSITAPLSTEIAWQLTGSEIRPSTKEHDGLRTIRWTLRDQPAASREPLQPLNHEGVPRLTATTYKSTQEALSLLAERLKAGVNYESRTFGPYLCEGAKNDTEKVERIQAHVNRQMGNAPIPLELTGYTLRDADDALRTAYGTEAEKCQLLATMLNAAGVKAEIVAVYPGTLDADRCGLKPIRELAVKATVDGQARYLSATNGRSTIARRSGLDKVLTLDGRPLTSIERETVTIDKREQISLSAESARDGYIICSLPAPTGGVESWGTTALPSRREGMLELPALLSERITYVITPAKGTRLLNSASAKAPRTIEKPFGKLTQTIAEKGETIEVTRSIELNRRQFSPAEYTSLRELLNAWNDPNARILLFE